MNPIHTTLAAVAALAAAGAAQKRGSRNATTSDAFRRWFGDSQVVDRAGNPLVVYHGAPDMRKIWEDGFRPSFTRGAVFFATDRSDMANSYADPKRAFDYRDAEPGLVPLYLSIQNPMILDGKGEHWRGTAGKIKAAKQAGNDGMIIYNSVDWYHKPPKRGGRRKGPYPYAGTVYVWFKPTQAKSAARGPIPSRFSGKPIPNTGPNRGTFDPEDTRISYNRRAP
tara:strand:- start:2590 stop:3261 length:672 start_codon:yes stop_codon:yes gene_type:complete